MNNYQHRLRFVDGKLQERVESTHYDDESGESCCVEDIWVDVPDTAENDDGYRKS